MSFLDTVTAAIDQVEYAGPWDKFRSDDPRRCAAAMQEARNSDAPVTLGVANAGSLTATLWSVDEAGGRMYFNVSDKLHEAAALVDAPEVWAAMYQGNVKIQFVLRNLVLSAVVAGRPGAPGAAGAAGAAYSLIADLPRTIYALPRRQAVRVRRTKDAVSVLRLRHPLQPEQGMTLRVLNISVTGCAVRKPAGLVPLLPGTAVKRVEVELDHQTVFFTDLTVMHVSYSSTSPGGDARVGCRWDNMPDSARKALALWIEGGRRRRELMSISFE